MNPLHDYNLRNAEAAFVLANTPLFLLRKLRSDPVARAMALELTEDEILSALKTAVQQEPTDIKEAVLPYLYVVALAIKGHITPLKQAVNIDAPHAKWFTYITNYLLQSFRPSTTQTVSIMMPRIITPQSSAQSVSKTTKSFTPSTTQTVSKVMPHVVTPQSSARSSLKTTVKNLKISEGQ